MRRILWFGLLFLSTTWLFFLPIFTPSNWEMGLCFLIIGIILIIFGLWKLEIRKIDKKYFFFLPLLLLPMFIIPYPFNIGIILVVMGGIGYFIVVYPLKYEKWTWIWHGISLSGLILLIQSMIFSFYINFASVNHRADFLSPFLHQLIKFFGLENTASNSILFVRAHNHLYSFLISWEHIGFYLWLNIFIGALVLFFFIPKIRKITLNIIVFLVLSIFYLLLRYILLLFIYTEIENLEIFWDPIFLFLSFIPFAFLLIKCCSLKHFAINLDILDKFKIRKKHIFCIILIFIFVFSAVGTYGFQDPGTEKKGRVLIDELHSDWESTLREMDKEWYGKVAVYNYYSLADWLNYYYNVDKNANQTITSELLDNYDILILKCPTNAYYREEIEAIKNFVNEGGGLFLIGDHTNVFGMNFYLNQIAKEFGIEFNYDATYELTTGMWSVYEPPKLLPHPVVQSMDEFHFLTSCSLTTSLFYEPIIVGYGLQAHPGTYSDEYFFRKGAEKTDISFGPFLQSAALKYGKGRIVAFTDSTCFSNYCMFMDGYPSYVQGAMNYLNRTNTFGYINIIFSVISVAAVGLLVYLFRKEKRFMIVFLAFSIGLLAFSIASPTISYINGMNYTPSQPISNFTKVCFEKDHSDFIISSHPTYDPLKNLKRFETFFVWTQRIGCIPSVEDSLDEALCNSDAVVIINPIKSFSAEEINDIQHYLENGGKVLMMDSVYNSDSTANDLLLHFDMQIWPFDDEQNVTITDIYSNELYQSKNDLLSVGKILNPYLIISGGRQILVNEKNQPILSICNWGKGILAVFVDSYTFSNYKMGSTFTIPNEQQTGIYNVEYYLLENLLLDSNIADLASIDGYIYLDENNNGSYDPLYDSAIVNVNVTVWKTDQFDSYTEQKYLVSKEVSVDEIGYYELSNIMPGYYMVNASLDGFIIHRSIVYLPSGHLTYNVSKENPAAVEGMVYYDSNANDKYDAGEEIEEATVEISYIKLDGETTLVDKTMTNKRGEYSFSLLTPGYYTINVTKFVSI